METSIIQEFYKGKQVFLTGGTGFMGKVLIEKLLRDTEVETIFVLVREKKGKSCEARIDDLFNDPLFEKLKSQKPKCRNRVEPISGDCAITGLGLSIHDKQRLISNINIIFHVAATVNFIEHIKLAYTINVNATKDILDLAREITNLKSIVHVSTAYSNCNRDIIEEKIYDTPISCSDLEMLLEKMTKHESELYTQTLLGDWPNTYTFTKALAETMIKSRGTGLPIGIFRPSIILCTYREPVSGWIDNLYGPTGLALGTMSGVVRLIQCNPYKICDFVPIDMCVAGIIASCWDIAQRREQNKKAMPVYNYVSSPENPVYWRDYLTINYDYCMDVPTTKSIWYPTVTCTRNQHSYVFLKFVLHLLPALFMDLGTLVVGGKPRLLKIYKKIDKFSEILKFFSLNEWTFSNKNVQNMWKNLNSTDKELFPFSMTTLSWLDYFRNYCSGLRKYLLKEGDGNIEEARQRLKRLKALHVVFKLILVGLATNLGASLLFSLMRSILRPITY